MEEKCLKRILTHLYIEPNIMKLTYIIQIYKSMFSMKNSLNSVNILRTGSKKNLRYLIAYGRGFLKHIEIYILRIYIALSVMLLTYSIKT